MSTLSPKDRIIPWYFVAFFAFIFVVNAAMITLATTTYTGTVTDHPYEKGIAYNRVIKAAQAQKRLGWSAEIALVNKTLRVTLRDANGTLLKPDKITAYISRPTQAGMDFDVVLDDGKAHIVFPEKGLWEIRIFAHIGERSYQQSKRVVVE